MTDFTKCRKCNYEPLSLVDSVNHSTIKCETQKIPIHIIKDRLKEDLLNGNLSLSLNISIHEFMDTFVDICIEEKNELEKIS